MQRFSLYESIPTLPPSGQISLTQPMQCHDGRQKERFKKWHSVAFRHKYVFGSIILLLLFLAIISTTTNTIDNYNNKYMAVWEHSAETELKGEISKNQ